jgi:hypothetical protein
MTMPGSATRAYSMHFLTKWGRRAWDSHTLNTWGSLSTKSVSLVIVLPQVLRGFSAEDAGVWFVFSSVLAVQNVLGFGFSPSFSRLLSYARAGAPVGQMEDLRSGAAIVSQLDTNWESIDQLCSCMRRVFFGLSLGSFVIMATVGTKSVGHSIALAGGRSSLWIAWFILCVVSSTTFWSTYYVSYLQGMDRLADWRRSEIVLSMAGIISAFIVLKAGGGVLPLVIAYQFWTLFSVLVYRRLCAEVTPQFLSLGQRSWEGRVFRLVWDSAWKNGITNILSNGLVQATGVIQAQSGTAAMTVTYNLMLRVVTMCSQVVQAPFITKLPELARRRALGDQEGQVRLLKRAMRFTHWGIVAIFCAVMFGAPIFISVLRPKALIFDPLLWSLFGLNLFFERHGAMLNQIRNLTNKPLEHIGIVGFFVINVTLMWWLHPSMGIYTYPIALLATQLSFSLWFSAATAYPVIGVEALSYERTVSAPPFLALLAALLIGLSVRGWI